MASEAFTLALLLTLKDAASGGLDRFEAKLRGLGKTGEVELKKLDKIREDLNRDLAIGGAGLAGLKVLKDGVQAAADYQAVMTDLRASIAQTGADGKVNYNQLAEEMRGAEAVAVNLGNKLPGTTADFAQMMQVMKQNGLDTTTILNGAADAVGNLAVASNAVPKELAADFARYGNLFKLKPEDFTPAADVFSRIYSSTGQTSAELIEAAKYFQGRAGQSLGIAGLKDAEKYTRLFGFLGKQGMTGSMAGMGLSNFFTAYNEHRDKLVDLQKSTGIKLDFFDKQGKFVGLDSVMSQMEQFDKLSAKDRSQWMETIFGTLGAGVGNVMIDAKGWKAFNEEQNKTISLQDKTAMKSKDFNNQMEALGGTLTNLKVAVFEPMLPGLTSAAQKANQLVGVIQEFVKANPNAAKLAGEFLMFGSAALVAYSGIKTLITGVRLFKMMSTFSRTEGLVGMLADTNAAIARTSGNVTSFATRANGNIAGFTGRINASEKGVTALGTAAVTTDKKVGGLRGSLQTLSQSGTVKMALDIAGIAAAEVSLTHILGIISEVEQRSGRVAENSFAATDLYEGLLQQGKVFGTPGVYGGKNMTLDEANALADPVVKAMKMDRSLEFALQPERAGTFEHFWTSQRPYTSPFSTKPGDRFGMPFDADVAGKQWGEAGLTRKLADPNVLARVISMLQDDLKLKPEGNAALIAALEKFSGKDKVDSALKILRGENPQAPVRQNPVSPFQVAPNAFPSVFDLKNPWGAPKFNFVQPMSSPAIGLKPAAQLPADSKAMHNVSKPVKLDLYNLPKIGKDLFQQPEGLKPQQLDLKKMLDLGKPTEVLNQLTTSVGANAVSFGQLTPSSAANAVNFQALIAPTTQSATSLEHMVDPANRMPGSFTRISAGANSVAEQLFAAGNRMASWQPPSSGGVQYGPDGKPMPVVNTGKGLAVGGNLTHSGLAYVHAKERIVPARATAFHDTIGRDLLMSKNTLNSVISHYDNRRATDLLFPFPLRQNGEAPKTPTGGSDRPISLSVMMSLSPMSQSATHSPSAAPYLAVSPFRSKPAEVSQRGGILERTKERSSRFSTDMFRARDESRFRIEEKLVRDAERAVASRTEVGVSKAQMPITINAPLTINASGGSAKEVQRIVEQSYAKHIENVKQMVESKVGAGEIERMISRALQNGRQRA